MFLSLISSPALLNSIPKFRLARFHFEFHCPHRFGIKDIGPHTFGRGIQYRSAGIFARISFAPKVLSGAVYQNSGSAVGGSDAGKFLRMMLILFCFELTT